MASRSWHCNSWDIIEREKPNTIWTFWHPKQKDFSETYHFEREKRNICLASYTVKTKSKGKKNVIVLSTYRPLHDKTIDDGKEKPQIIKFYDFTKGGTDIVDHLNDCYTTRLKSCCWVMVALSHVLDTAKVNGKTMWCLKNDSDTSSTSLYDFSWNLVKALALPHVQRRSLNGLVSSVQSRIKMFLCNGAFSRWASTESREKIHRNRIKEKMSITHCQFPHKDIKGKCPKLNWTVPIMWYHYLPGTFNASLLWLLTVISY